jgi:hypothetical protein
MPDLATLQAWLAESYVARHQLLTGQAVASVSYGGNGGSTATTFTKADLPRLDEHIADLSRQVAGLTGNASSIRRGPVQLVF